jgi:transposase
VEAEERIAALETTVAELIETLAARDARIIELQALLDESRRSGKRQAAPFSKGAPKDEPAQPGRKKGGSHGRHGHRAVPPEPDRIVDAPLPECCPHCGDSVDFERWAEQSQTELPEPRPVITRFRVGVGRCRGCHRRVQGRHPEQTSDALGAAGSQVGPRAMAWATWLHYALGLSFEKTSTVLARMGINVTAGAICAASASTSTDLVPTHQAIKTHVATAPAVTMDETGWRIGGEGVWLWVAATDDATIYDIARGRGFDQAIGLVPADYSGTIVRDGWAAYNSYTKASHQTCLAHLLRRCHQMITDQPAWTRGTPHQSKISCSKPSTPETSTRPTEPTPSPISVNVSTCSANKPIPTTPTASSSNISAMNVPRCSASSPSTVSTPPTGEANKQSDQLSSTGRSGEATAPTGEPKPRAGS